VTRAEERQVGHDHDGGGCATTGEDGERPIDDAGERAGGRVAKRHRAVLTRRGRDILSVGGDQHAVDAAGAHGDGDDAIEESARDLVAATPRGGGEARLSAGEAARRDDGPGAAQAQARDGHPRAHKSTSANESTSAARRARSSRVVITVREGRAAMPLGASSPSSITMPVSRSP